MTTNRLGATGRGANLRWRGLLILGLGITLSFAACADDEPTAPATRVTEPKEPNEPTRPGGGVLGLVEVTISGLGGDGELRTSAISAASLADLHAARRIGSTDRDEAARHALTPPSLPSGDGTIQLEPLSTGSFTMGTRGAGGVRYVSATYRVRNAQQDGTAYDTPRQNLTFLAVATSGTLGGTAISSLRRFDGSNAAAGIAGTILPTGAVRLDPARGAVVPAAADVLQVLLEAEVDAVDLTNHPGVVTVFPYGFVVSNPNDAAGRTLPADPEPDQFDGLVTFAFKIPLQDQAADDPFTVSIVFLAVDDDEVRITQSLEEQTPEGEAAFVARATALNATLVTVLPGSTYEGEGVRPICSARIAGTAESPSSYLVDECEDGARSWLGLVDSEWNSPGNWLPAGVPTAIDTVQIPMAANKPVLTGPATIAGLGVADGMSLDLGAYDLTVTGKVEVGSAGGMVTGTTGRLILEGIGPTTVGGRLPRVIVKGDYTLAGQAELKGELVVDSGKLYNAGHRLIISN